MISGLALLLKVSTPGVMGAATLSWAPRGQGRLLTPVAQGGAAELLEAGVPL